MLNASTTVPDVNCFVRKANVGSCPGIVEKMGAQFRTIKITGPEAKVIGQLGIHCIKIISYLKPQFQYIRQEYAWL
jgi:hypothetical protein